MRKADPAKIAFVLDFLHRGGELEVNGAIYVWLDNLKVRETETHEFFIDGLARKLTSTDLSTGEQSPYYMGCSDMTLNYFFKLVDELPMRVYSPMLLKLKEMRDKDEQ